MDINTNFILLVSKLDADKPEVFIFNRFSDLCKYVNAENLHRKAYKVFLSNLDEISDLEYKLIPDINFQK